MVVQLVPKYSIYQTDGKLSEVRGFDNDSQLIYMEKHTYTPKGHGINIEHTDYNGYRGKYGSYKLYNATGLLVELKSWEYNTMNQQTYTYQTIGDTIKEYHTNVTNSKRTLNKYTIIRPTLRTREVIDSTSEIREVYQYDSIGNLIAWERYDKKGDLQHQITFYLRPEKQLEGSVSIN